MKNNSKTLFSRFISFSYGSIVTLLLGIISTPLITRLISPIEYGKMSMFNMAINIFGILAILGFDQVYIRYFHNNTLSKTKLLYKSIALPFFLSVMISLILVFNKDYLLYILFSEVNNVVVYLLIINVVFFVLNRFGMLVVRMEQKGNVYSLLTILQKIIYISSIIITYNFYGDSYVTILMAMTLSIIFPTLISIYNGREIWKFKKNTVLNDPEIEGIKELLKYGLPFVLTLLISWAFTSSDKLAINHWSTLEEVGLFAAATSIIVLFTTFQGAFATFWIPVANEQYEKNSENREFYNDMYNTVCSVVFVGAILMIGFKDLIVLFLGENYRNASSIIPFLVFIPVLHTISEITVQGINFKKRTSYHTVIVSISLLVNVIGNYSLVPFLGAKGAAISTGLSYILFFYLRTLISESLFKVGYNLKRTSISIFIVLLYALYSTFIPYNVLSILLGLIALSLIVLSYLNEINLGISIFKKNIREKITLYKV